MNNHVLACFLFAALFAHAEDAPARKTILAIGAHCGDMEISAGAILAKHAGMGDRVVILHLTLGERGNPRLSPEEYAAEKRREAAEAAGVLGAEAIFGPYKDAELPNDEQSRRYVASVIRKVRPTHIITHWKNSFHRDHSTTRAVTVDAVLLAELEGVPVEGAPHRGVRGVYYAENWEDEEGFVPYLYVDVTPVFGQWKKAVTKYQFIRGGVSPFAYLDYYEALARVRGARSGKRYAVALDVDQDARKLVVNDLR